MFSLFCFFEILLSVSSALFLYHTVKFNRSIVFYDILKLRLERENMGRPRVIKLFSKNVDSNQGKLGENAVSDYYSNYVRYRYLSITI